jgi:hypothetical protein
MMEDVSFIIGAQQERGCDATIELQSGAYAFDCVDNMLCDWQGHCDPIAVRDDGFDWLGVDGVPQKRCWVYE